MKGAARLFFVAGVLLLGYVGYVDLDTRAYQTIERRRLDNVRLHLSAAATPTVRREGDTIGQIVSVRLGLNAVIAQGESPAVLRRAVGHLADTALPGEVGNVVLAGHRDTFFRPLKDARAGDTIRVRTQSGDFDYVVESTAVVTPTDIQVLEPTGGRTLTLITCFPFAFIGSAPDRFIVRAREVVGVQ